ncbi:MAG: hypothetical protein KDA17_04300 [Candidatus Saccharibacteria bacterium]|mgnify:CR=1 FL=1|jgi:hypothetical protein|nr:hypothetical protein [Patescibacteria group bacterium]MCA9335421.1 hypothetical protein [Candidatus Saccharibacteria bacterium]MCA9336664.1 hypothetical protein [Candidatus Saccharibacteria bacterium]MCA9340106.1 hypothetical protein [Candidatus Saccharibacteria bacterium]HPQ82746.1 hypothetical protein [Candidatus Saccharimonas sp.]
MKKNDIAMIILIASVSALIAFFVGDQLSFLKVDPKGVKVPVATPIETAVETPNAKVFNSGAINPTVQTVIGGGATSN